MREVVAVCRSVGKDRKSAALVLDRYLWRVGDRTWRGVASNQCLARISEDLRKRSSRKIAVTVHGFASGEERILFRIGSRSKFDLEGRAPVSTGRSGGRRTGSENGSTMRAAVRIAAIFHDIGKAGRIFQDKLARAIAGQGSEADPIRHELISAAVWDVIAGDVDAGNLSEHLRNLKPSDIDDAFNIGATSCAGLLTAGPSARLPFRFISRHDIVAVIGMLILCHHRLSSATKTGNAIEARDYILPGVHVSPDQLKVAPGSPFWHGEWFRSALVREADLITDAITPATLDLHARTAFMLSDHFGSAQKEFGDGLGHVANSLRGQDEGFSAADSLEKHTARVYQAVRGACDAIITARNNYPGLSADQVPDAIISPDPNGPERFAWQGRAAEMARISVREGGGFFAAVLAGTGTGKTRGAPVILAGAAMGDPDAQRQKLRYTLGLGLRTLATQSGREYVADLGFSRRDVSVMIGTPPLKFPENSDVGGSEDMLAGLSGIDIVEADEVIPAEDSPFVSDWVKGLSYDPDRQLPQFITAKCKEDPAHGHKMLRLCEAPIICATIDHIIAAASPARSSHLAAALRVMTSDLVIDEVDQFSPEDCAVVARLVNLAAASGRRVILLSATMSQPLVEALSAAYEAGWASYASQFGTSPLVSYLVTSDALSTKACQVTRDAGAVSALMAEVRDVSSKEAELKHALRHAEILECPDLASLPAAVSWKISEMHDRHAVDLNGFKVSFGFVRMTRISHTVALASALPPAPGRLRLAICLHSRMKRMTRAWIEKQLKAALTRKGHDPHIGLRGLCREQDVFVRAREAGATDVELVLICSPVIETGNDLDFDYAILDPMSMRAIVQSAGRVNRHRAGAATAPNVALISSPVQVLENRRLSMPGVETEPPQACLVSRVDLAGLTGGSRSTKDLLGGVTLSRLDASWMSPDSAALSQAECELLVSYLEKRGDVCQWATSPVLRNSTSVMDARKFRRSTSKSITLFMMPSGYRAISWFRDDGIRGMDPEQIVIHQCPGLASPLFRELDRQAMEALYGEENVGRYRMRRATEVDWPVYGDTSQAKIDAVYSSDFGMIRAEHLSLFSVDSA